MNPTAATHRLYVHIAWSTLGDAPALAPGRRAAIETRLMAVSRSLGADPIETCVLPDRIHLLARIPAGLAVSDLARRARDTAREALLEGGHVLRWSDRYAAVTVAPREVRRVRKRLAMLAWTPESTPRRLAVFDRVNGTVLLRQYTSVVS